MEVDTIRVRSRVIPFPISVTANITLGQFYVRPIGSPSWQVSGAPITYKLNSRGYSGNSEELTLDEVHEGPPFHAGGPFKHLEISTCNPFAVTWGSGTYFHPTPSLLGVAEYKYVGGFMMPPSPSFGTWVGFDPISSHISEDSLDFPSSAPWYDRAWSRTRPKLAQVSGAVFLAEMRDLPRMLKTTAGAFHDMWSAVGGSVTTKNMLPKKAADHFLNHQFGWVPFLKDMQSISDTLSNSELIIDKLTENNNQYKRRHVILNAETVSTLMSEGNFDSYWINSSFLGTGNSTNWFRPGTRPTFKLYEDITTFVNAVGKYRFYRPEFDKTLPDYSSAMSAMRRQMTLYGLRISPSNIYKATPWTWAIDWFSNVGDYIDRSDDVLLDSVAAQYLYLMQHKVTTRRLVITLPWRSGDVVKTWQRSIDTKQREEALSPYGFSLSMDNLSPRQIAIAGALGVSKFY